MEEDLTTESETYGDVTVDITSCAVFRGTLLDASTDRTGLMQWPGRVGAAEWLVAHRADLRGLRLLELGCGAGGCSAVAVACGLHVLCTDASDAALALAAANLGRNARPHGGRGRCAKHTWGDEFIGFAEGAFDVVFGADIIYPHITDPVLAALFASARRALARPSSPPPSPSSTLLTGSFVLSFVPRVPGAVRRLFAAAHSARCSARFLRTAATGGAALFAFTFDDDRTEPRAPPSFEASPLYTAAVAAYPDLWLHQEEGPPPTDDDDANSDVSWGELPFQGDL